MYKVPESLGGGGEASLSSLLGKNIKYVVKGEGNIMGVGKKIMMKKGIREEISFSLIKDAMLGRISNWEEGKEQWKFGE